MNRRAVVSLLLIAAAGCLSDGPSAGAGSDDGGSSDDGQTGDDGPDAEADGGTDSSSPDPETVDGLYDPLPGLVTAENRTAYAERNGLDVEDDTVQVTIVRAHEGAEPPADLIHTELTRSDTRILARVRIDDLAALADHESVERVQPPSTASPTG